MSSRKDWAPFTGAAANPERPRTVNKLMEFVDSDAFTSSDDDREQTHVQTASRPAPANHFPGGRRPSSGWIQDIQPNRKFSLPTVSLGSAAVGSNPTTPSLELPNAKSVSNFPWNTNSFGPSQTATKFKEVVASPTTAIGSGDKPFLSPTYEGEDNAGFPLSHPQSMRKSVRSQSYSIGQADIENSPIGQFSTRLRGSLRHRPSKPSLLGEGLAQLREDEADELESSNGSEQGVRLPPGYWEREQKQALRKQAAEQNARARHRAASTASPGVGSSRHPQQMSAHNDSDFAVDEAAIEDHESTYQPWSPATLTRRFSEHIQSQPGYVRPNSGNKPSVYESTGLLHYTPPAMAADQLGRRHSFATVGSHNQQQQYVPSEYTYNEEEENAGVGPVAEEEETAVENVNEPFDPNAYFTGYGPMAKVINASTISAAHPDPPASQSGPTNHAYTQGAYGRPGRRLFVVTFKCSRADIYYTYDNTGLEIRAGDLVITEGDRGCDLGQVSHADVSPEDAKRLKSEALDEHFRWLVMFSQYSLAGAKEPGMLGALARANGYPNTSRSGLSSMGGQQQEHDTKPRMIKRLAQQHEIMALRDKEGSEAKAKREAAKKAVEHKLPMEILDAEFQADFHKLTLFYYADAYVNFNPLVVDIFKMFKIRIWMSAVNPASVVNPNAQLQPPSAIGPGAIMHPHSGNQRAVGGFQGQRGGHRSTGYQPQYGYQGPFEHQMPGYHPQQAWDPYGRQWQMGYPAMSGAGTPVGYGGYYPPASTGGYSAPGYTTYSSYDPAFLTALQNLNMYGN